MNNRLSASLVAITATALLSACSSDDANPSPTTAAAPQPASSEAQPPVQSPAQTASTNESAESAAIAPGEPTPGQGPEKPLPSEPEAGSCLDVNSQVVGAAFSSLSPSPRNDGWVAGESSDAPAGNCPGLEYVLAETPGGTASSPTQVLFFHDNTYLGTATSEAYSYTTIAGSSDNSVSVNYRWLENTDASCCPSGGPATITYTWDGSQVVMEQPLPQEMLDAYAE
ncbi:LppP/LprE family lipoprotein [Rhodococcus sp. NPDC058521]|uniref:LppP/LprE family lipoprotein n=1 Tax=Rhodococcus sp. NPDC058521 TaxID=3346536 RepID=UPI0036647153